MMINCPKGVRVLGIAYPPTHYLCYLWVRGWEGILQIYIERLRQVTLHCVNKLLAFIKMMYINYIIMCLNSAILSIDIGLQPTNRYVLGLDEFGELNK
jgi:hypothetical protein